ncbi:MULTISPECIES: WhiB family transcriptional regulator [Mycobacterium]|uniref:4Fe-4S Wbl-type domain-containing protein n=2 Tax=Mycobacterium TaxID=1763 RepID=A0A2G5PR53_MYCCE|nr:MULTISPECIES: WhiB family transcriptional regulator [Mycobacterium]EID12953.1 WhiB family transcriptional regulator [Mycobacterium xenopi RIVM700367]MCV7232782.1 WhiB family transcriptional regulator [Mycobacterium branderi]ORA40920.1 hypothetical protein BST20_01870 [Mycobacterium branderi]PIB80543.1 hypothetical protein CQY23_03110 [Mycobacterium celatum]BBZ09814.1 hypothetical protein MBRA_00090 [Mycobacterium branderi]
MSATLLAWTEHAACRPHPAWTPASEPHAAEMAAMQAICDGCPVIAQCAWYTLSEQLETVVCAGVYVPERKRARRYADAQRQLKHKAAIGKRPQR